jgi:hypothetical protein
MNAARLALLAVLTLVTGCRSHFETPEVQGPAAMVDDGGQPRLWVLSKQEEQRQVGVPGGGTRSASYWRTDTFFHFDVQAFDPVAAKPLWRKRLLTLGDPEAEGREPSRVIGSSVGARLLGQDGALVWLLIGAAPFAVSAADGSVVAEGEALQQVNPTLKGLLPTEAKHYGFDRGLVLMAADARRFVIRGPKHEAVPYTPPPPPAEPEGRLKANGTREIVPMRPPFGDVPARQTMLEGQWLGLYSDKEAADAGDDEWGTKLFYPYSVLNEGRLTRRAFWRAKIVTAQRFDDRYERLADLTPVAGGPTFLNGRFAKNAAGDPLVLEDPAGVLVWSSTRIDAAGRLALARLDAQLASVWSTELPLSEVDTVNQIATWHLPGRLVVAGVQQTEDAGVTRREPYLVSVDLENGATNASKLTEPGR